MNYTKAGCLKVKYDTDLYHPYQVASWNEVVWNDSNALSVSIMTDSGHWHSQLLQIFRLHLSFHAVF
jgi:hypothetical protein